MANDKKAGNAIALPAFLVSYSPFFLLPGQRLQRLPFLNFLQHFFFNFLLSRSTIGQGKRTPIISSAPWICCFIGMAYN